MEDTASRPSQSHEPLQTMLQHSRPTEGVVSKTVFRSPVFNLILPVRLTDEDRNTFAFIGEDFVHFEELQPDGTLERIATKASLPATIRAASVFGLLEATDVPHMKSSQSTDGDRNLSTSSCTPSQAVVLTLESQELMFLLASPDSDGRLQLSCPVVSLPPGKTLAEEPGHVVAVDPKSRAIAVAARENTLVLYSTTQTIEPSDDFGKWCPIRSERILRFQGSILLADFIFPPADHAGVVILIVITAERGSIFLSCYDWEYQDGLKGIRPIIDGQRLEEDDYPPLLLIPLRLSADFMLVGPRTVRVYKDVILGHAVCVHTANIVRQPGAEQEVPLCTQWVRITQRHQHAPSEELIYIVADNGRMFYLQVPQSGSLSIGGGGRFRCLVDTAFAVKSARGPLDFETLTHSELTLSGPDVLLAAGSGSYGQILSIGDYLGDRNNPARSRSEALAPRPIGSIPNWSPSTDFLVLDHHPIVDDDRPLIAGGYTRDRAFVASGREPYGTISELRKGIEIKLELLLDGLDFDAATGMWSFESTSTPSILIIHSSPIQTSLLRLSQEPGEDIECSFLEEGDFDTQNETIAAATIDNLIACQVSRQKIVVLDPSSLEAYRSIEVGAACSILLAGIQDYFVTIVWRSQQGVKLSVLRTDSLEADWSRAVQEESTLSFEPTCLRLMTLGRYTWLCLGSADGLLQIYHLKDGMTWRPSLLAPRLSTLRLSAPCESIIDQERSLFQTHLICGLRNGALATIAIQVAEDFKEDEDPVVEAFAPLAGSGTIKENASLGRSSIRLFATSYGNYAICSTTLYHIKLRPALVRAEVELERVEVEVNNVWMTDHDQPGYQQSSISTILQRPLHMTSSAWLPGVVCASQSELMVGRPSNGPVAVPRRIAINGSPYRMVFSQTCQKVIMATQITSEKGSRTAIQAIDMNPPETVLSSVTLKANERVLCISEWTMDPKHVKSTSFIIVGTDLSYKGSHTGRLIFLQLRKDDDGNSYLHQSKSKEYSDPVYAAVELYNNLLAISIGTTLRVVEFDRDSKRLDTLCDYSLISPGIHLSTYEANIYVTTTKHSVIALELRLQQIEYPDRGDDEHWFLTRFFSDNRARTGLNHLSFGACGELLFATDKTRSLIGLKIPKTQSLKQAVPTSFEAALPRSVTRLKLGRTKSPYHSRPYDKKIFHSIRTEELMGIASDGTVFDFTTLDHGGCAILKFLEQAILLRDRTMVSSTTTSPLSRYRHSAIRRKMLALRGDRDNRPVELTPFDYHVNGDLFDDILAGDVREEVNMLLDGLGADLKEKWIELVKQFTSRCDGQDLIKGREEDTVEWVTEFLWQWI